jgi:hypothetical protein
LNTIANTHTDTTIVDVYLNAKVAFLELIPHAAERIAMGVIVVNTASGQ